MSRTVPVTGLLRVKLWRESTDTAVRSDIRRWEAARSVLTLARLRTALGDGPISAADGDSAAGESDPSWTTILTESEWTTFSATRSHVLVRTMDEPTKKKMQHGARDHIDRYRFRGDWSAHSKKQTLSGLPPVLTHRSSSSSDAHADPVELGEIDSFAEWVLLDEYGAPIVAVSPPGGLACTSSSTTPYNPLNQPFPGALAALLLNPPTTSPASISFTLNGASVSVQNPDPAMMLANWLRESVQLTGTKIGCGEGGCGSCMVLMTSRSASGATVSVNVNSCMHLLSSCDGSSITTVEGLGSERTGLHPIQQSIATNSATQCGYCTPGFVMTMYGLLASTPQPTQQQIEDRFDSNICRCTGYRPIFKAMRAVVPSTNADTDDKHSVRQCHADDAVCGDVSHTDAPRLVPCGQGSGASCSSAAKSACHSVGVRCGSGSGSGDMEDLVFDARNPRHLLPVVFGPTMVNRSTTWSSTPDAIFITPTNVADVQTIMRFYAASRTVVRLVSGNTSIGVIKYCTFNPLFDDPTVFVRVAHLPELLTIALTPAGLSVGSSVSIDLLTRTLESPPAPVPDPTRTSSWTALALHMRKVASQSIRAVGTWAGNLMIAKAHTEFPSDLLTIFAAARATITLSSSTGGTRTIFVSELQTTVVAVDEFVLSMTVPYTTPLQSFDSYKTRARHQLAHPIVNAACLMTYTGDKNVDGFPIIQDATIAYGGLFPTGLFLAAQTQAALEGQTLTPELVASSMLTLQHEITTTRAAQLYVRDRSTGSVHDAASPALIQSSLALTLLYKFLLAQLSQVAGYTLPSRDLSATVPFVRPISSGVELFTVDATTAPVGAPIPKLSGRAQTTGEAMYSNDEVMGPNGLYASFVSSIVASGTIVSIDASHALAMTGVTRFISAADLATLPPDGTAGRNDCGAFPGDEEIFASTNVHCMGQSVGLILADSQQHANVAARAVIVVYAAPSNPPIFTIDQAIDAKSFLTDNVFQQNNPPLVRGDVAAGFVASSHVVSGSTVSGGQKHFSIETQSSYAVPDEQGGLTLYTASQGTQTMRQAVAHALSIPSNRIIVVTKRCGGAFGGKLSRSVPLACAVSIAAILTGRPVKAQCDRQQDSIMWGARPQFRMDYKVGYAEATGKILAVQSQYYQQGGYSYESNLGTMFMAMTWSDNMYYFPAFSVSGSVCRVNTPSNTAMRGPGVVKSVFATEMIIERVAYESGLTPDAVRIANFYTEGQKTPYLEPVVNIRMTRVWDALLVQSDYTATQASVRAFNSANRWRKRGVHISVCKYGIMDTGMGNQTVLTLQVCVDDGSIQLSHNGIEMGQGIHVKVVQSICYELSLVSADIIVTVDMVRVLPTSTGHTVNGSETGGSSTSEACCAVAILAAQELKKRLAPVLASHPSINTWAGLIAASVSSRVDLQVSSQYMTSDPPLPSLFSYFVYCAACSQVDLDVLTGEYDIRCVDIVYDCGASLNPSVDIGQIEGAFMIGIGQAMMEEVVHDTYTGQLISQGSFDYHVPSSHDIPIQFNVTLLPNDPNPTGVLSSKATAEPPVTLAVSAFLALRDCIVAARADAGNTQWVELPMPATTKRVQQACCITTQNLVV